MITLKPSAIVVLLKYMKATRRLGQSIKREGENDREMIEEEHLEMIDDEKDDLLTFYLTMKKVLQTQ